MPFSPTDISGLQLWLKADSLSLSNNDPVASWSDSSGNGNTATQATSGQRPLYKTGILNSLPIVRFDGSDDVLGGAISNITADVSIFVVSKFRVTGDEALVDLSSDGTSTNVAQQLFLFSGQLYCRGPGTSDAALYSFSDTTSFLIHNGNYHTNLRESFQNNVSQATGTATLGNATPIAYRIGRLFQDYYPLDGDIAEVIIYNSVLSSGDRTSVYDYLNTKWFSAGPSGPAIPVLMNQYRQRWG